MLDVPTSWSALPLQMLPGALFGLVMAGMLTALTSGKNDSPVGLTRRIVLFGCLAAFFGGAYVAGSWVMQKIGPEFGF